MELHVDLESNTCKGIYIYYVLIDLLKEMTTKVFEDDPSL